MKNTKFSDKDFPIDSQDIYEKEIDLGDIDFTKRITNLFDDANTVFFSAVYDTKNTF